MEARLKRTGVCVGGVKALRDQALEGYARGQQDGGSSPLSHYWSFGGSWEPDRISDWLPSSLGTGQSGRSKAGPTNKAPEAE